MDNGFVSSGPHQPAPLAGSGQVHSQSFVAFSQPLCEDCLLGRQLSGQSSSSNNKNNNNQPKNRQCLSPEGFLIPKRKEDDAV